jgi:predicted nuclease of predicted toxin-antitoxin system
MGDKPHSILYTDENVPLAVVEELRRRGVDVLRCQEAGMMGKGDAEHLRLAASQKRVILTFDQDFLRLNKEFNTTGESHAGIIFVTSVHLSVGSIVKPVFEIWQDIEAELMKNIVRFI